MIAALAFIGWTMLEPTSVWNVIDPGMSSGTRTLIALVGAVFLTALTKALASHSDDKPSPAQRSVRAAALRRAPPPKPTPAAATNAQPAQDHPAPAPDAPTPTPNGVAAGDEPSVPKWVY
jgi:hypothetical protein